MLVPIDDSLLSGPEGRLSDTQLLFDNLAQCAVDGVLAFSGSFSQHYVEAKLARVVNLTASTTLGRHTHKVIVGSVQQALRLGADAVAAHINVSSQYEPEMLTTLGIIGVEADASGLPFVVIAYPRSEGASGDENYEEMRKHDIDAYAVLVRHTCRIAADLGADIIKTCYTGTPESFATVVQAVNPLPVLIAGGPLISGFEMLTMAKGALDGGASGVSFGRNIFLRPDPVPYIRALVRVVRHGASAEAAMNENAISL